MQVNIEKADQRGYRLTAALSVAESRDEVFKYFADAFHLESLTPPWLRFSVKTPPPIEMETGTLIEYQIRLYGIPLRWQSKIILWEPPAKFVDEQVKGPYRFWRHQHLFLQTERGTLIRDVVDYDVPLGWLVHPLLVRRNLEKIFQYRGQAIGRQFTPLPEAGRADRSQKPGP